MNSPVILEQEAINDLRTAREWYERSSLASGVRFAECVAQSLDRISQFPRMYAIVWKNVRIAHIGQYPYNIYYLIHATHISVLAVLHAKRDASAWKPRISKT